MELLGGNFAVCFFMGKNLRFYRHFQVRFLDIPLGIEYNCMENRMSGRIFACR